MGDYSGCYVWILLSYRCREFKMIKLTENHTNRVIRSKEKEFQTRACLAIDVLRIPESPQKSIQHIRLGTELRGVCKNRVKETILSLTQNT